MKLLKKQERDGQYELSFLFQFDTEEVAVDVQFQEHWSLTSKTNQDNFLEKFAEVAGFHLMQEDFDEEKPSFSTVAIHIPSVMGRGIFQECYKYVIERTNLPAFVSFRQHPGYPITIVTYNSFVVKDNAIHRLSESIMTAIKEASVVVTPVEIDEEEEQEEEDLLAAEDAPVVEMEFDKELQELMKQPVPDRYVDLEGSDDDD